MLDLRRVSGNLNEINRLMDARDPQADYPSQLESLVRLYEESKEVRTEVESLRARQNELSRRIGEGEKDLIQEASENKEELQQLEDELEEKEEEVRQRNLMLPNIPHPDIPLSPNEKDKVVMDTYRIDDVEPLSSADHLEIGNRLGILDFESARISSGSGFPYWRNQGARLEWALLNYFVEQAQEVGYEFHLPPVFVRESSMETTGMFPKFRDDSYITQQDGLVVVPTAEAVLAGSLQGRRFEEGDLPFKFMAYTPCFRREAGAAGQRDKGLLRVHQFNKVELFNVATPYQSEGLLEEMVEYSSGLLRDLDIPHRITLLPAGDLGQQASITYDLEVFVPSRGDFLEVSSCSNCYDYQARRGDIRFNFAERRGTEFVHTLNGSALATPRLFASIIENNYFKTEKGSPNIKIPPPLRKYLGSETLL